MADKKITDLAELTSVDDNDVLAIVDDPAGTPETKKIKKINLMKPAGSDTQVQFNDGGVFGGDADFAWDKSLNILTLFGDINFGVGGTRTIKTLNQTVADTDSDALFIKTGNGLGIGGGGAIQFYPGDGGSAGNGGGIFFQSGAGGSVSGNGGGIDFAGGDAQASGDGGNITFGAGFGAGGGGNGSIQMSIAGNQVLALDDSAFSIRTGGAGLFALLDTTGLSTSNKTFAFPNQSGTIDVTASARKYKKDIVDIKSGLDLVEKLTPREFTYKDSGRKAFGLVAEEVAEVDPRLAMYGKDGELEGVQYKELTAVLIKAIQELKEEIKKLKERIE